MAQNVDQSANPARLDPSSWRGDSLTIANLGHATLLMDYFGVRVITDPSLFEHVGLAFGPLFTIGPERHVAPPLSPAELQSVDVILITHAHMDHLDIPVAQDHAEKGDRSSVPPMFQSDRAARFRGCARAQMGRADRNRRTQSHRDGRQALGPPLALG
ncbi:MAG: MBL fold metallo-hydrolase [Candidatus Binatales bacterium]